MKNANQARHITVAEMAPHVHNFLPAENKVEKISKWLINWIQSSLKSKKIRSYDFLPSKGDLAFHIGVSKGTIQNVYRYVEDCGFVESKQRIGTYVRVQGSSGELEKLTSKRELAIDCIKKYILASNYKIGEELISARKLAVITGISNSTVRLAISHLVSEGLLQREGKIFRILNLNFEVEEKTPMTLVEKISSDIKGFIEKEYSAGNKIPPNIELAKRFNVSVKTIHDALKILSKEGIVLSRRGQYGTILLNKNSKNTERQYFYEKIEQKIKNYIVGNCKIGDKLPPIVQLAEMLEVSAKTVKKALDELAEDGFVTFARGRWGGTFVTDLPQGGEEAYQWLAISSDYVSNIVN